MSPPLTEGRAAFSGRRRISCGFPPGATAMALWEVPRSIPTEGGGGGLRGAGADCDEVGEESERASEQERGER